MSKLVIRGGKPLSGRHVAPGNKNAALPMLAAALLADGPVTLDNLPDIADVRVMAEGLRALGARVEGDLAAHTLTIDPTRLRADPDVPAAICTKIRTSFLFAGVNIFASALFTALSDGRTSAIISFARTFGFLMAGLLLLPRVLGVTGVWIAVPVAEAVSCLLSISFLWHYRAKFGYGAIPA